MTECATSCRGRSSRDYAWTTRVVEDPKLVRELMVERGALERLKLSEPIPVLVDHDQDRQVGTVREVFVWEDVLPGPVVAPWFASIDLTDAPGWLKRNGGVSWSHKKLWQMEIAGTTLLRRALISPQSMGKARRASGPRGMGR